MAEIVVSFEPERAAAVIRADIPTADLPEFFDRAFGAVARVVEEQGRVITGPPFAHYPSMPAETVEVEAGFPVDRDVQPAGDVQPAVLPGGPVYRALHQGPYETLSQTYGELGARIVADGRRPVGGMWESYLTDPGEEPDPGKWLTEVVQPVVP